MEITSNVFGSKLYSSVTLIELETLLAQTDDLVALIRTAMVNLPWLFVAWWTVIGAAVGSFLNVVVHRMPAGLSISHPPSRCPKCETRIRARDNIPVLGWFLLGGRCRNCQLPISTRYPLVEAIVAAMFCSLGVVAVMRTLTAADVLTIFFRLMYFSTLVACLIGFVLIDLDRNRIPPRLFAFSLAVACIAPLVRPECRITSLGWDPMTVSSTGRSLLVLVLLAQAAFGAATSLLLTLASPARTGGRSFVETAVLSAVVVGWWGVVVPMTGCAAFVNWFQSRSTDRRISQCAVLAMCTYVVVLIQFAGAN